MKKFIAWLLVLALTAAVSIGATLAYLTDTDEDVNVMTVGKVKIDQLEYERIDTESKDEDATVQEFHDNKPLYPSVYEDGFDFGNEDNYVNWDQIGKDDYTSGIWNPDEINNEVDKMVFVKNKGNYDAYVRTVFAFEAGNYETLAQFREMVHLNLNDSDWTWEWAETPVQIGESTYFVATATYNQVLEPGAFTEISLSQIALDKTATNEDVEAFGDTYHVLVKSQAIQADGFDTAATALDEGFGVVDADNIPWINDNATVGATLKNALHYLNADTTGTKISSKVTNVVFGLNEDYPQIADGYKGVLMDVEQDVPVYAYYVPNGSNYDVYLLANDDIYAPANSRQLFSGMSRLVTADVSNLNVSRVTNAKEMFASCTALKSVIGSGDWDTGNMTTMVSMFDYCRALKELDTSGWDTGKVTRMDYMFYDCNQLTALDVSGWDLGSLTNLNSTFFNCKSLKTLDVSNWDLSNVSMFYSAFYRCSGLEELDTSKWDIGSATNLSFAFQDCSSLTTLDVSNWDTSNVSLLLQTFFGCSKLTALDVTDWDLSNATSLNYTFAHCVNLEELDPSGFDVSKVEDMSSTFQGCLKLKSLDLSGWDVSNVKTMKAMFAGMNSNSMDMSLEDLNLDGWNPVSVTDLSYLFYGCANLTQLDLSDWNMPNLKTASHMFADCSGLVSVDVSGWKTPSLTSMDAMFNDCRSLITVDVSSFDTSKVLEFSQLFEACWSLTHITGLENWDTTSAATFEQMFMTCSSLKELNLSSFSTYTAQDSYYAQNNSWSNAFTNMFSGVNALETLTLGENFCFIGNGSVAADHQVKLPSPAKIDGQATKWYNAETDTYCDASEIPQETAATYVAKVPPVTP